MSLFARIFGSRATPEQKIARAHAAIADGDPELALKILVAVDGAEARALVDRARDAIGERDGVHPSRDPVHAADPPSLWTSPDPAPRPRAESPAEITISFGADGSQTIGSGADVVTFNRPRSDADGRPRSPDGLAVARRLVAALAGARTAIEEPAFPFVDAALLLARAGTTTPARDIASRRRRRLAEMCAAAAARDAQQVIAIANTDELLRGYVVPLVRPFAPIALAPFAPLDLGVLRAIAAADRAAAQIMLDASPAAAWPPEAALAALDRGLDAAPLFAHWPAIDDAKGAGAHARRALEVRRLARTDLDAARALYETMRTLHGHDDDAALAIAARDPDAALAHAMTLDPDCDVLGWLHGCVRGAPDRCGALVDRWIAHLSPATYHPYKFFRGVLEACLRLGDAARTRALCTAGGPTGWQVAHAARWWLGAAPNRAALLDACLAPYPAGCVAGRAAEPEGGLVVGMAVVRPAWLALVDPHPVETLSIVAALGPDGPAWSDDALP